MLVALFVLLVYLCHFIFSGLIQYLIWHWQSRIFQSVRFIQGKSGDFEAIIIHYCWWTYTICLPSLFAIAICYCFPLVPWG